MLKTIHSIILPMIAFLTLNSVRASSADNDIFFPTEPNHDGWLSLNNENFFISKENKTWDAAETFCESQGAYLAQPTNATQVLTLAGLIKGVIDREKFWVGARSQNTTTYRWINGNEVTAGWHAFNPTQRHPERCILLILRVGNLFNNSGLGDWNCKTTVLRRFICQISDEPSRSHSTTTTKTTKQVIWYVSGGVLALLLLGVLCVVCFRRRNHGKPSTSDNMELQQGQIRAPDINRNAVRPTSQHQYSDPDEVIPPASHQGNAVRPSSHHHQYSDPDELIPSAAHQGNISGSNIEAIYEDGDVLPTPVYPGNITYSNIGTSYEEPIVLPTPVYPGDSANNYLILQ